LFEWSDERQLWLGTRDDDVMRWAEGRFCLGDANKVRYTSAHEFVTLYDLIASTLTEYGWA
jgi:hypothetical protein